MTILEHPTVAAAAERFEAQVSAVTAGLDLVPVSTSVLACELLWVGTDMAHPFGRKVEEGACSRLVQPGAKWRNQPWRCPIAKDLCIVDADGTWRAKRLIDAEWYVYLHDLMRSYQGDHKRGFIDAEYWQQLRTRFALIHKWACKHIGLAVLNAGLKAPRPAKLLPPKLLRRFGHY